VRLTPPQAKHIAASMRIALAARLEGAWPHPLPDRAEVEGLRALVNSYADELAMLEWGEPQQDVELLCQRVRLERLARELIEAGAEQINDQPIAGPERRDMISAARAITAVLARDRSPAAGA
jgi:hypothetical protein